MRQKLAADTLSGQMTARLGKPTDAEDAKRMLSKLSLVRLTIASTALLCDALAFKSPLLMERQLLSL